MKKYTGHLLVLSSIVVLINGCTSKKLYFTNPSIPNKELRIQMGKKAQFECMSKALAAVPYKSHSLPSSTSGNFEIRDMYSGNVYNGSYNSRTNYGAFGGAIERAQMDRLRKKIFLLCMEGKGWKPIEKETRTSLGAFVDKIKK